MSQDLQRTIITDRDGNPHNYTTTPFAYDKSVDMKLKLMGIIVRPLADAFGELLSGATEGSTNDPANFILDFATVIEAIDWRQIGPIVQKVPERLVAAGGSELIAQLLDGTIRRTGDDVALKLNNPGSRSKAFSGGNQIESYKAIKWILEVNYAPFSAGESGGWMESFDELKNLFVTTLAEVSSRTSGETTTEQKPVETD